jgi:SRSO17 transposase
VKHNQHTTLFGTRTSPAEVGRWAQELVHLHARIARRFARPEPRRRALAYLQGILSETGRKNGWQLAEYAGEACPDGMQRLLASAVLDTHGVRDDLRSYELEHLGQESAILAIDETSFPKRGKQSAGVGVQYCGTTGQVENCQVGVFLSYVTAKGHTLIDRELYLPMEWCEDRQRCRAVGIPESVRFQTKPELAVLMLQRICQAQLPIAWVVADTVYGGNLDLRTWLEVHRYCYVLAVACNEPVGFQTPAGRRREEAALVESFVLHALLWQRLAMSEGTKGPRLFAARGAKPGARFASLVRVARHPLLVPVRRAIRSFYGLPRIRPDCPTRSGTAHRSIHQQRYKYHIGVTDRLTIAWLEQVAAKFHEDADAR